MGLVGLSDYASLIRPTGFYSKRVEKEQAPLTPA